jgi:hypothetical protein
VRKLLLDLPSTRPALGFGETADALAQIVEHSDPRFAVGVFGGWGSGKSTLMQAIEARLDSDRIVAVRFSAWRYEKEEHLIVPLLDTVREALLEWSASRPVDEPRARRTAATVGRVMRSIIAGMSMKIGVPGAVDLSFDANKALAAHAADGEEDDDAMVPGSFYHASFRALQAAFGGFVGPGPATTRRIVVFVDDLDRCLPESALQVLESMKLFFDLPGFVFVVGLDQEVVEHVIDAKYGRPVDEQDVGARARVSGAEYIKKIFQLPYRLAPVAVEQLDDFLEAAYEEASLTLPQREELRDSVAPHLRFLVGDAAVNPREIKRYINAYTLLVEIDRAGRLRPQAVLALQTIAFREEWSRAQDALLEYGDLFADALRRQTDGQADALADLDPELQSVPDELLDYVSAGAPGRALLEVGSLAPYLTSGEATRSTQDPRLLDALRAAGSVRRMLGQAAGGARSLADVAPEVLKVLPLVEGSLASRSGPVADAVSLRLGELRDRLDRVVGTAGAKFASPEDEREQAVQLETTAREVARRLLRLYRQGNVAAKMAA